MIIKTLKEELKNAVSLTSHFISPKAQLPILGNIYLKAEKTKLILSATNLETSVSTAIGVKVEKEGEITIPGRTLLDIVSNVSPGNIEISVEKEQVKITSGSFKSVISAINTSDYPKVPEKIGSKNNIQLDKEEFFKALTKCLFAVSSDETRPVLTGVLLFFKPKNIYLVATDGFRLSQVKIAVDDLTKEKIFADKLIIPKSVLLELVKSTLEDQIVLGYSKTDNQVLFGEGDTVFSSRIIEGEYPDFEKIIPTKSSIKVTLDKEEFSQSIKLASVFAREAGNILKLTVKSNFLRITAESQTSGSQENKVEAKVETDKDLVKGFEISFNYRFIEELINVINGDELIIEFSETNAPGKFLDPKDSEFLHLIMPIKTGE